MALGESNHAKLYFADANVTLDVRRFEVHESMSRLWSVVAYGACSDPRVEFSGVVDHGAAFVLDRPGRATTPRRLWTGICAEVTHASAPPDEQGVSLYRVRIVPELWRLSLNRQSRVFQHAAGIQIILAILEEWGFVLGRQVVVRNVTEKDAGRYLAREMTVQYEESDFAFISRLLEDSGLSLYFEYAPDIAGDSDRVRGRDLTRIVIDAEPQAAELESASDASSAKQKPDYLKYIVGPLAYLGEHSDAKNLGLATDAVINASVTRLVRPGAVTILDRDFRDQLGLRVSDSSHVPEGGKEAKPLPDGSHESGLTSESKYQQYSFRAGYLASEGDPAKGDDFKLDKQASIHETFAIRSSRYVTKFLTNALEVAPGSVVMFGEANDLGLTELTSGAEHPRTELGGKKKHLVVETSLRGDTMGGWHVSCVAVRAEEVFRPARSTPRPRIHGVQSALVVGPSTSDLEYVYSDDFGRVRVQFHWDRQHRFGEPLQAEDGKHVEAIGSCWVRVASPWAGSGYGMVATPRVGHEVVVAFLDGDPDQPVIVRSLHNAPHPSPYSLPESRTKTGLKSNSSPNGHGFNELSFEDAAGREQLSIQAQKDLSAIVKGAESHSVGSSQSTTIGAGDTLHTGDRWQLAVGQDGVGISVDGAMLTVQVGGADGSYVQISDSCVTILAKGDIHFHAGADLEFSALNDVNVDGLDPKGTAPICINHPSRVATAVSIPGYAQAGDPSPGASLPPGQKPEGGGGKPGPVGEQHHDVEFQITETPIGPT